MNQKLFSTSWMVAVVFATIGCLSFCSRVEALSLAGYVGYPTGSWPEAVAIADLNGDGRKDVVLTTSSYFNTNDQSVLIFYQNASGTLNAPIQYAAGGDATTAAIADLNGDGRLDIAVGKKTAGIRIFWQDAGKTFTNFTDYATANAYKIVAGDFNNDGRIDLAGIGWSSGSVDVFTQSQAGTVLFSRSLSASYSGYNDLKAGDVNGDGLTDIVVMNGQTYAVPNVSVLLQTNGGFSQPVICDLGGSELTAGVGIGDVGGDGRNDIVVCYGGNRPNSKLAVFNQMANGSFVKGTPLDAYDIPQGIVVADMDMDGLADVVTVHGGWNNGGIYLQGGAGALKPELLFPLPYASSYNPHGVAVGDVTGDGLPDIVIADYNHGLLVVRNTTPPPALRISRLQLKPNGVVLAAPYLGPRGTCLVQSSDSLTNWVTIGTMTDSTWTDSDTSASHRFYRLQAQ